MNWTIAVGVLLFGWSTMPFVTTKEQLQGQRFFCLPLLIVASLLLGHAL